MPRTSSPVAPNAPIIPSRASVGGNVQTVMALCRGMVVHVYVGSMPSSQDEGSLLRPSAANYPRFPAVVGHAAPSRTNCGAVRRVPDCVPLLRKA